MLRSVLQDNWEQFISFTDLMQVGEEKSFGGYKVHITTDPDSGITPIVETFSGNISERNRLPILVEEEKRDARLVNLPLEG